MSRVEWKNATTGIVSTATGFGTLILREGQNIADKVSPSPEQVGATTLWVLAVGVIGGLAARGIYSYFSRR